MIYLNSYNIMLLILILIPILSLLHIILINNNIIKISLYYSIINFIHINIIIFLYNPLISQFQFVYNGLLGIDGISLWFIWLINLLQIILILNINNTYYLKFYIINLISIWLISIILFLILDLLYFFICFELILIPMFYLIGFYGSRNKKISALYQLLLYTILGSLPLMFNIILLYILLGTTNYDILLMIPLNYNLQLFLWLGFFISFAIKIPIFPFHIWLPLVHTEGNTIASIILAAILLKLGSYGFYRYLLPILPDATIYYLPLIYILAIISIIYSCISALSLIDLKQIIAYSSIAHMNVGIIGIFSNNIQGLLGSYIYNISHGLISTGLFLLIGILYDRYHTRIYLYYRGLIYILPLYIFIYLLFILFNISFPGSSGFISEILIYYSQLLNNIFYTFIITLVSFFLPLYFFKIFHNISYGHFSNYLPIIYNDLTLKEFNSFLILILYILIIGLNPNFIIINLEMSILNLLI